MNVFESVTSELEKRGYKCSINTADDVLMLNFGEDKHIGLSSEECQFILDLLSSDSSIHYEIESGYLIYDSCVEQYLLGGNSPAHWFFRQEPKFVGNSIGTAPYVEFSRVSSKFSCMALLQENFSELIMRRTGMMEWREIVRRTGFARLSEIKPFWVTAKIFNVPGESNQERASRSIDLLESCLFMISLKSELVMVPSALEIRPFRSKRFVTQTRGARGIVNLPIPRSRIRSVPMRYYQLGRDSRILALQYLSFYQVIEYFFLEVVDDELKSKVRRILLNPDFRLTDRGISSLVREFSSTRAEYDEKAMLNSVLERYVSKPDFVTLVNEYESWSGIKWYTKKRSLFGENVQIDTNLDRLLASVSHRIKTVRNALVHSTNRFTTGARHVPFSSDDKILQHEIHLVRWLAEEVLMSTASDSEWLAGIAWQENEGSLFATDEDVERE